MKFSEEREAIFWEASLLRDDLYGSRPTQALADVAGFARGDNGNSQDGLDQEKARMYLMRVIASSLAALESLELPFGTP